MTESIPFKTPTERRDNLGNIHGTSKGRRYSIWTDLRPVAEQVIAKREREEDKRVRREVRQVPLLDPLRGVKASVREKWQDLKERLPGDRRPERDRVAPLPPLPSWRPALTRAEARIGLEQERAAQRSRAVRNGEQVITEGEQHTNTARAVTQDGALEGGADGGAAQIPSNERRRQAPNQYPAVLSLNLDLPIYTAPPLQGEGAQISSQSDSALPVREERTESIDESQRAVREETRKDIYLQQIQDMRKTGLISVDDRIDYGTWHSDALEARIHSIYAELGDKIKVDITAEDDVTALSEDNRDILEGVKSFFGDLNEGAQNIKNEATVTEYVQKLEQLVAEEGSTIDFGKRAEYILSTQVGKIAFAKFCTDHGIQLIALIPSGRAVVTIARIIVEAQELSKLLQGAETTQVDRATNATIAVLLGKGPNDEANIVDVLQATSHMLSLLIKPFELIASKIQPTNVGEVVTPVVAEPV